MDSRDGQTRVVYTIPSRGLFGFMTNFLTMTKGYGIISHSFIDYRPMEGETVGKRNLGVLFQLIVDKQQLIHLEVLKTVE